MIPQASPWLRYYLSSISSFKPLWSPCNRKEEHVWDDGATGMCMLCCEGLYGNCSFLTFPNEISQPLRAWSLWKSWWNTSRNAKMGMRPETNPPSEFLSTASQVPARTPRVWLPRAPPILRDGLRTQASDLFKCFTSVMGKIKTTWRLQGEPVISSWTFSSLMGTV